MTDYKELYRRKAARLYLQLNLHQNAALQEAAGLAASIFQVPIALITFMDEEVQYITHHVGVELKEMPRSTSFCTYAIEQSAPMVVTDARLDPRFAQAPVVAGPPGIRFYAGQVLRSPEGFGVGTLCVYDVQARQPTDGQMELLQQLASQIEVILAMEMELNRLTQSVEISQVQLQKFEAHGQAQRAQLQTATSALERISFDLLEEEEKASFTKALDVLRQLASRS